jgi:hypothetical protein
MTSFISKLKERFSPKEPKVAVEFDAAGFTILEDEKPKVRAEWSRVREIFAYKDDLWSYDEICIGFRFNDAGDYWWVGESYIGYREFRENLKVRFPEILTDWFSDVAFPAFAQNRTTLWGVPQPQTQK